MSIGFTVSLMRSAVLQVLMMAAPMLLIGMVVGLIVSIFQATTSIQEQTLTFVPKIVAILGALMVFGPWILNSMVQFTLRLMALIGDMSG
ncbi:MAG TPA: flagellar biosynthesis protein FliQ [Spirochaetales bacterium]|nr:flagellar biosynthesis protein FliQ [Spirochaetales bacterium]